MTRITALRVFARWWVDLSIVLIAIGAFGIAVNDGVDRMAAIVNPFNMSNILAIVGLFIPAFVASRWAKSLENAALRGEDEAQRLVNASLADFQASVVSGETQRAETAAPSAEWKAVNEKHPAKGVE